MLAMTVRSFLRHPQRPVVFLPVYFGYERIVEGSTYIGELSGKPKEKESVFGLLRALPKLRERFGHVHVNIGEPHPARRRARPVRSAVAQAHARTTTRGCPGSMPPSTSSPAAIMRNINAAAAVTPINLLAVTLLAAPRQALPEPDLQRQLELYLALLRELSVQRPRHGHGARRRRRSSRTARR